MGWSPCSVSRRSQSKKKTIRNDGKLVLAFWIDSKRAGGDALKIWIGAMQEEKEEEVYWQDL